MWEFNLKFDKMLQNLKQLRNNLNVSFDYHWVYQIKIKQFWKSSKI